MEGGYSLIELMYDIEVITEVLFVFVELERIYFGFYLSCYIHLKAEFLKFLMVLLS